MTEDGADAGDGSQADDPTLAIVRRLARRHPSGGSVIERAAILAEGADCAEVVAWIVAHAGVAEEASETPNRGLHSARAATSSRPPARYVLPAGALSS
ncbi:MAG: hypothetical protein NVSMB25_24460 [Thermoleophilaceae bacterium]